MIGTQLISGVCVVAVDDAGDGLLPEPAPQAATPQ
jgi:hypothetical protein